MQRHPVTSSDLQSVGYDPTSQTLEIEFHSGGIYQYYGVPVTVYRALMAAGSHEQYFHAYIKDRYSWSRVS